MVIHFTSCGILYKLLSLGLSFLISKMGNVNVVVKIKWRHKYEVLRTAPRTPRILVKTLTVEPSPPSVCV